MSWLIFFLSLVPAVAWIVYFYYQDRYEKEPLRLLIWSFILGCLSVIPAIIIELYLTGVIEFQIPFSPLRIMVMMLMVGFTEEICKYLGVRYGTYKNPEFNEPMDGIVYSVTVAMGFAFVENIGYMLKFQAASGLIGAVSIGILRALFSMFGHATFGVIQGYFIGKARFNPRQERQLIWTGVFLASIVHALYNFTLEINRGALGVILVLPAFVLVWKSMNRVTIDAAEYDSPFRPESEEFQPKSWRWRILEVTGTLIIAGAIYIAVTTFNNPVTCIIPSGNYQVMHPSYWQREQKSRRGPLELTGPAFRGEQPKVKLDVIKVEPHWDSDQEIEAIISNLAESTRDFKKTESRRLILDGRDSPFVQINWTKEIPGRDNVPMVSLIAVTERENKIARIVATVPRDQFSHTRKKIWGIIESFRFTR